MIYFVILAFLILLSIITKAKLPSEITFLLFVVLNVVLICFVGLRGNIDPDYESYLSIFENSSDTFSISSQIEPGYYLLNHFVRINNLPFQVVIFVTAFISIYFKVDFFRKYSPNFALSVLIYFCSVFFLFDFIAIRQAAALSIFMMSIPFIYERKFLPYCLLLILAAQIHISAILLIPGYFLFGRDFSKKTLFGIVLLCAIINALQIRVPLIDLVLGFIPIPGGSADKVAVYLTNNEFSFVSIKQIILGLLFVYVKFGLKHEDRMLNILVNLFAFGILIGTIFNGLPQLSYRIKWYFFWTESILMVYTVEYFARKDLKVIFLMYGILFIIYGYTLINFLNEVSSRGDYIFPYKFFFQ